MGKITFMDNITVTVGRRQGKNNGHAPPPTSSAAV